MEKKEKETKKTNLERLRQIYELSKNSSSQNVNWWSPSWGDNIIRVLPPIDENDVFFFEIAKHRVNNEWYYCLKYKKDPETGKTSPCPVCEYRTKLFRSGDKDLIKIAKDIKPKKQFLMNIIDRKSEEPTVYVYSAGIKIWNKMVSTMLDDDIDITDIEEGYDFLIKKEEGAKTELGQFPNYDNSKAKRKPSPLHEDPSVVKSILNSRYDLKSIPIYESYDELKSIVEDFVQTLTRPIGEEQKVFEKPSTTEPNIPNIKEFKEKLLKNLRADDETDEDE